jgi:hypothetical protein
LLGVSGCHEIVDSAIWTQRFRPLIDHFLNGLTIISGRAWHTARFAEDLAMKQSLAFERAFRRSYKMARARYDLPAWQAMWGDVLSQRWGFSGARHFKDC